MKQMKILCVLLLTTALLCGMLGLTGCSAPVYQVTVVDALGTPYTSGVIVRFMQDGKQIAMQPVDENGVATKELEKGDYTVELLFTDNAEQYYYDKESLTLSASQMELKVVLSYSMLGESTTLVVQSAEYAAYAVKEGSNYVPLKAGQRNYFLFTPTKAGTYRFSTTEEKSSVGYYGNPHFVQEQSAAEVKEGAVSISVSAGMIGTSDDSGTTVLVIGVDAPEGMSNGTLCVQRTGDPEWSIEDEPWSTYAAKKEPVAYTLPKGAKLAAFDIKAATDTYKLVLNESDGYYHLNTADGPLVLMYLGENGKYITGYKTILEHTGAVKYFYDENGKFVKKENYTDCLFKYVECIDKEAGVYPLTEDLKYILQQNGDHQGWWKKDSRAYLFVDGDRNPVPGINNEIAWLDICCYIAG